MQNMPQFYSVEQSKNMESLWSYLCFKLICVCLTFQLAFFSDRQGFQVGSLSHMMNLKANGYQELPQFPDVAPDPSVRNVEVSTRCI